MLGDFSILVRNKIYIYTYTRMCYTRILYLALKACASPIYSGVQPPREKDAYTCPLLLAEDTSLRDISK